MDNAVALAALALTTTIATGFFAVINKQNATHEKLSRSIDKMSDSSKLVADTNESIAVAVTQQAKESAERNGHIVELIIESRDNIIGSVQHVDTQEVEHQLVKKRS